MSAIVPPEETAAEAGLIYVTDEMPGIERRRVGEGFDYFGPDGKEIADEGELARIRSLTIPPAYENVWICPLPNGHLQATGRDARGRKQYRYHPRFREVRDAHKFEKMIDFGRALPKIRERLDHDLRKRGLPREKVLAAVVHLLEKSLIRVGNEEYAKENKSYGLTTMRDRHVQIDGAKLKFKFIGKGKIKHEITLADRRLARVVKQAQDLPGQTLFQYIGEDGERRAVTSADVNAYLKEITGDDFTAKDFRTWMGTVLALTELAGIEAGESKSQTKRNVTSVVKVVSKQLGNTPTICRKCYVHPAVIESYASGSLREFMERRQTQTPEAAADLMECAEEVVLELLEHHRRGLLEVLEESVERARRKRAS
jgi:DNA topoisomerase I